MRKLNIKFNLIKLKYEKEKKMIILCMIFGVRGIKTPDIERVKFIFEFKMLQNIKHLHSFLLMVQYCSIFKNIYTLYV